MEGGGLEWRSGLSTNKSIDCMKNDEIEAAIIDATAHDPDILGFVTVILRRTGDGYNTAVLTNMSADEAANVLGTVAMRTKKEKVSN
jgi:hypothetical protein